MEGNIFKFLPRWKEELVCQCSKGQFVLDYAMGTPTIYLPSKERWLKVAPKWAHQSWDELFAQLSTWCTLNGVLLAIDQYAEHPLELE